MEIRNFDLQKSGDQDQPVLHGYAVRWNELSQPLPFLERFLPGAFQESIGKGADVLALVDHDTGKVIGRRSNGTLSLTEDSEGLRVEIKPNIGTTWGRDIISLVERRDVTGMSIGFKADVDEWDRKDGKQIRNVQKATLVECSVVVNPAYAGTNIDKRNLKGDGKVKVNERELRQKIDDLEKRQGELLDDENADSNEITKVAREIREARTELENYTKEEPKSEKRTIAASPRNPEREKIEKRQAFNNYLRTGNLETRDNLMELDDDTKGGYTAPEDFRAEVIQEIQDLSAMRQVCRILPPIRGKQAAFPRLTDGVGAAFTEEGDGITEDDATFDQVTLVPKKCAALVPVSNELLHDSGIDIAAFLAKHFAEVIAEEIEDEYINGDGSGADPTGILHGGTLTRVSADAEEALAWTDISALYSAVPAKYRKTAVWVMHPDVEATLRDMTDADGNYLLVNNFTQGMSKNILGRPIYLSDEFPNTMTAGLDVMAFGDFKRGVFIGDSAGIDIQRNESYGFNKDVTYFRAIFRTDIAIALANCVRVLKMDSGE